jgi:hypothetical protein
MESLYHAYQAYERQVEKGVFSTYALKAPRGKPLFHERLLAGLGDTLIQAGLNLKRHYAASQTMGSPALGKLNR